ncbi:MAG: quinoprotein dehydrogenase-associated putative ABC transporter substrate-binding protein [Gemmatimonadetes bacterium]|nr:MAG: quinoprotein dehydrogenase-associated putative ABC transporter substrate-binding protein [Gemmatimonadota bacterium]
MYLLFRNLAVAALTLSMAPSTAPSQASSQSKSEKNVLRVCADPNNLPFSNERRQGFENRIAELLARDLHAKLEYTWWAQRRGFVRNTLKAHSCDVIMGVPTGLGMVLPSSPYYRSTYVFVTRRDGHINPRSFDDPVLRRVRVGVQLIGDDGANTPPAHALSNRGIIYNVKGYAVYGIARGDIDVAVAWGPMAGYWAKRSRVPLKLVPVQPQIDLPILPFVFDIGLGVRHGESAFRASLDSVLVRRRPEIQRILDEYGVPQLKVGSPTEASTS